MALMRTDGACLGCLSVEGHALNIQLPSLLMIIAHHDTVDMPQK